MKCEYCNKEAQLVKKPFSWGLFWMFTIFTLGMGFWIYPVYRLLFIWRNRCHHCGAKIGIKWLP